MALFRRAVGECWIAYYPFYVAIAFFGRWQNRNRPQWSQLLREDQVYLLAAILGVAAGFALLAAIIVGSVDIQIGQSTRLVSQGIRL